MDDENGSMCECDECGAIENALSYLTEVIIIYLKHISIIKWIGNIADAVIRHHRDICVEVLSYLCL